MQKLKFIYSQQQLQDTADLILKRALKMGATTAQVEINEGIETAVTVLNGNIEQFENSYSSAVALTVYIGHQRGSVAQSEIKLDTIDALIKKSLSLAQYTQADQYNGIAQPEWLSLTPTTDDLSLYNPITVSNQALIGDNKNLEELGLQSSNIKTSDGASSSLGHYNFILANTNDFNHGYQTTRYAKSLSLIGENTNGLQADYWADTSRDYSDLLNNQQLADTAIARTVRRLNSGIINSGTFSVIFESPIAKSLIANYLAAISGNNLFRKLSFLNDSLGKTVFPQWVNIYEDPFIKCGNASCYFDNEGVKVQKRSLVYNGSVAGYLLNCYTARKLNLASTGNAGGAHNVIVEPNYHGTLNDLTQILNRGLIIIDTIGQGVNLVTGDYSVGASAIWVENGKSQFFVDNLTISGNLKDIYKNIVYIADDSNNHSSIRCGSLLVENLQVTAKSS